MKPFPDTGPADTGSPETGPTDTGQEGGGEEGASGEEGAGATANERIGPMTTPGFFQLYPAARPALPAGDYTATSNQKLVAQTPHDGAQQIDRRHRVPSRHRCARYEMP
jgi:hypothetical protein